MRFPKRSGFRPRGRASEALPFADGVIAEIDGAATRSLCGQWKNKMRATYKTQSFNKPGRNQIK